MFNSAGLGYYSEEGNFIIIATTPFQMKLREAKKLAQDHTFGQW